LATGTPQDTDNNSADFVLVATDPLVVGNNAVLGALAELVGRDFSPFGS
jgi:hypothetical protein